MWGMRRSTRSARIWTVLVALTGLAVVGAWTFVIYVVALVGIVVGVDILFFRHYVWARLLANVGIVLVFAAFSLRFQNAFGGRPG